MKKEILNKISIMSNGIDKAKVESIKSQLYYDGYLDCIKDIMSGENSSLLEILEKKYEGKAKQEAYNDMSELVSNFKKYIESLDDSNSIVEATDFSIHPNERAQKFLDRINKNKG